MWPQEHGCSPVVVPCDTKVTPFSLVASGRREATAPSEHTSRTAMGSLYPGPHAPTESHFLLITELHIHIKHPYLFPDRVVAQKAADFTPGQRPGGVGVPISRQHFDVQGLQLARVEGPAGRRTWVEMDVVRCLSPLQSQQGGSAWAPSLSTHGAEHPGFPRFLGAPWG